MVNLQVRRNYFFILIILLALTYFSGSVVLADSANVSVTIAITECSDGIDNDFDSFIDFPNDPDCDTLSDDDESAPPAPPPPVIDTGGGGGSGSNDSPTQQIKPQITSILFKGIATPSARIVILRNGFNYLSGQADSGGRFSIEDKQAVPGTHTFSVKAIDKEGRESALVTFSIVIPKDRAVSVADIVIPPTIELSSDIIRAGGTVVVSGETIPNSEVSVVIEDKKFNLRSNNLGIYRESLSLGLSDGSYTVRSAIIASDNTSRFSAALLLRVGSINFSRTLGPVGDLDGNNRVDLVDFSILAFWYRKDNVPARVDLNQDGLVDLQDMSILAYYWSG